MSMKNSDRTHDCVAQCLNQLQTHDCVAQCLNQLGHFVPPINTNKEVKVGSRCHEGVDAFRGKPVSSTEQTA